MLHWSWEGGFVNPIHLTPSVGAQYAVATVGVSTENKNKPRLHIFAIPPQKKTPKPEDGGDERRILRASAALISTSLILFTL